MSADDRAPSLLGRVRDAFRADPTPDADLDELLGVLANERRRRIIRYLAGLEPDASVGVGELAEVIAVHETAAPDRDAVRASQRKAPYVAVLQTHAPRLDEDGVVDFDKRAAEVSRGPRFDAFADLLAEIDAATGGEGA